MDLLKCCIFLLYFQQEFVDNQLHKALHMDQLPDHVTSFAKRSIDSLLKMVSYEHPLSIHWVPKGEMVDSNMFEFIGERASHVCDWTVWPAVLDSEGRVIRKGVVIPV